MVLPFLKTNWRRLSLQRFGDPARLSAMTVTPQFRASGHVIFFVLTETNRQPVLVAKVPRLPGPSERLRREAANLQMIQAARPSGFDSIPRLVAFEDCHGWPLLLETALPGWPVGTVLVRRRTKMCLDAVIRWLADVHHATATRNRTVKGWFARTVEAPLEQLEIMLPAEKQTVERVRALALSLAECEFPLAFEHGDLSSPNLLLLEDGSIGVVDWELSEVTSLPAMDLFFFLSFVAFARQQPRSTADFVLAFHRAFFAPDAWARQHLVRFAESAGLQPATLKALFVLCWSRYLAKLLSRVAAPSGGAPLGNNDLAWLYSNRYFALWRHSTEFADKLVGW